LVKLTRNFAKSKLKQKNAQIVVGSDNWSMPNVDTEYDFQPIRAIFTGDEKKNDGSLKPFEIRLDFYDFRTSINDYTVFQVILD